MSFAMSSLVFLFLSLLAVRRTSGVNCTIEDYNPCRCVLSGGYSGIVDFSPIFKDGPLYYRDLFTLEINPCVTEKNKYAVTYRDESHVFRYGSIGTETREFEFSEFLLNEDKFQFDLKYFSESGYHDVLVTFTYQPAVNHKVDLIALGPLYFGPIVRDGVELKVVSKYVKPLIFTEVDTVGPYSIEHDVCAGWHGERPLLDQVGLLGLAAPVVSLNSTYSMNPSEYYLGVCVNPLKDSGTSEDCYAARRAYNSFDYENQCIGRGIQAKFVNQRDQGWMLLRYPFSDYIDDCKGYAVTEILFTCDHRDQAASLPMYPENDFIVQCRYQFIWPTHLACPNLTSPSGGSPSFLNPSSILLGMSGSVLVLLLLVTVGVSVSTCYLYRRERKRRSINLSEPTNESTPALSVPGDSGELLVNEERLYEEVLEQEEMDD